MSGGANAELPSPVFELNKIESQSDEYAGIKREPKPDDGVRHRRRFSRAALSGNRKHYFGDCLRRFSIIVVCSTLMDPELEKLVESSKLTSKAAEKLDHLKPGTFCL